MFNAYDLFQSIDVIVDSRLQSLNLDRTLICTVSHDSLKMYGQYEVTHNATRFTAYSEKTDYTIGDIVYVGVPQNDYSNAYIISKKLGDANIVNQADPFEDFIQMTEYKYKDREKVDIIISQEIHEYLQTPIFKQSIVDIEPYANMGLSFVVSSNLPEDCKYGFIVQVKTEETLNDKQSYYKTHLFTFSSNEMIGNASQFFGEFVQKKLIDINKLKNIVEVKVFLNFDLGTTPLTSSHYLYFKDISITFGYLKSSYEEDSILLYTNGSYSYEYSQEKNSLKPKNDLFIRWLYKNGLGKLVAVTAKNPEDVPENAKIIWYQYESGSWIRLSENDNQLSITCIPSKYKTTEQFKCIIEYEVFGQEIPVEYESNILVLSNNTVGFNDIVENNSFILTTTTQDFSGYYNMDGSIADYAMSTETRAITANFNIADGPWETGGDEIAIFLQWKVPRVNSMIMVDEQTFTIEGDSWVYKEEIPLPSQLNNYELLKLENSNKIMRNMVYQIRDYYSPIFKNNTISCDINVVKINNQEILQTDTKILSLDFRRPGVCEKDSVLILEMYNAQNNRVRSIKPKEVLTVTAKIYDNTGAEVNIVKNITWEWHSGNDNSDILIKESSGKDTCYIKAGKMTTLANSIDNYSDYAYILCAKYTLESSLGAREIIGYLPIAINSLGMIKYLSGPTQIVYGSSGGNPSYYNGRYKILQNSGYEMPNAIYQVHSPKTYQSDGINNTLYPLVATINRENWLIPKSTFIKEADRNCCIVIRNSNNILCWIQPILIYQTNSFSSFINEWDGKMNIDTENNVAMMGRLGAGKKNEDGTYSGVLLGDWVSQIEDGSWNGTGIFGYDHGHAAYGLKEDGTAFIGKSGAGRINFNGNEGLIYSDNFDGTIYGVQENQTLLSIANDLDDNLNLTNVFNGKLKGVGTLKQIKIEDAIFIENTSTGAIWLTVPVQSGFLNNGDKILVSYELSFNKLVFYNDGAELTEEQIDRTSSLYLTCAKSYRINDSDTDIENDSTHFWQGRVYARSKIYVRAEIVIDTNETSVTSIKIPLVNMELQNGTSVDEGKIITRLVSLDLQNILFYKVVAEDRDIRNGTVPKTIEYDDLFAYYYGNQGTYMNLKNGTLITNNGIFRGKLIAQDLEVENTVTIGNMETGKYIILDPKEGVTLGASAVAGGDNQKQEPNVNIAVKVLPKSVSEMTQSDLSEIVKENQIVLACYPSGSTIGWDVLFGAQLSETLTVDFLPEYTDRTLNAGRYIGYMDISIKKPQ